MLARLCSPIALHCLEFCCDASAFRVFRTNKHFKTLKSRYSLKELVSGNNFDDAVESTCIIRILHLYNCAPLKILRNQGVSLSVIQLSFGHSFNQLIPRNTLPHSLKHLHFSHQYNQPISRNVLPPFLLRLTFGWSFNQPIEPNVLPSTLTRLEFGRYFNQVIVEKSLPDSIEYLKFGWFFNQPLSNHTLPRGLRCLKMFCRLNSFPLPPLPSATVTRYTLNQSTQLLYLKTVEATESNRSAAVARVRVCGL